MKYKIFAILLLIVTTHLKGQTSAMNIHNNIMANYLQFSGKNKQAYELYKKMFSTQAPIYAYKGYIHLLFDTSNFLHIAQLIPQLDKVFEHDPSIQLIFAQSLEKSGQIEDADTRYIQLNNRFKNNQEIAFNAANSYLRRKEPENAIHVIDGLLNTSARKSNNFIFHFMKAQIYIQTNKKKEALASVQKSLDMQPRFDKAWLLFALLHEQEGQLNDAIKGYTNFLETSGTGHNKEIEQHLLQLIFKQKIQQQSFKGNPTLKQSLDKAILLFEKKEYQKALDEINNCIKNEPKSTQKKLLKIEILSAMGDENKAAKCLEKWILEEPRNNMWYKVLHLLTQANLPSNQAISVLKKVEKADSKNMLPSLYLADLYTRTHNIPKAISYLTKALKMTTNKSLYEKILFQLGFVSYEASRFNTFKHVIQYATKQHVEYPPLLNLIAYYYTMHEKNYHKAQMLADTALKRDPFNPHYLDTQAMIHLKQGNVNEAIILLEKIAEKIPDDYTILMHLAHAYHQGNFNKQAVQTLELAHQRAKKHKEINESETLLSQWKQSKNPHHYIASAL
jgi:tetratricopeptide (TPR) repeat protein